MHLSGKTDLKEIVAAHRLDGFNDVFWNLGQVVAWVWTRSPFPVDALSDAPELARRDHSLFPEQPHFAAELADRCTDENGLPTAEMPFNSDDDARRAVLRGFQSGAMIASGQRSISSTREPIPAMEWAGLTISDSLEGEMITRQREGRYPAWHDVRVPRDEVLKCFPETNSDMLERERSSAITDSAAKATRKTVEAKSKGRKPGQGSYGKLDAPLLLEMKQLISQGRVASAEEAARQVAPRAHGGGTVESKAERLARRFRKQEA